MSVMTADASEGANKASGSWKLLDSGGQRGESFTKGKSEEMKNINTENVQDIQLYFDQCPTNSMVVLS